MSTFEIKMPKLGESVQEATITKWFVKENDTIEEDQVLLEIATDKVDSEIPSPVSGRISKILFKVDDKVAVGTVIAIIDLNGSSGEISDNIQDIKEMASINQVQKRETEASTEKAEKSERFYSPLVKSISKKENISLKELDSVSGTGKDGRIRKDDILKYIESRQSVLVSEASVQTEGQKELSKPLITTSEGDEVIEMDRMRKLIAEHMVMSKRTSPHVTSVIEADVTHLVLWREKVKHNVEKRDKIKITFMPVFIEAVAKSLKDFPMVNSSVNGTKIILRKSINIGVAVALPTGNLIVPVIKNADKRNLLGIASELNRLADNARTNKLNPDDIQGGTFTITNFGSFRNIIGTPIINQPQVAILATGMIQKVPSVLETPTGDVIAIRHKMYLSLTYDHRIIDGALGGAFLKSITDYLEKWDLYREV
jgi:2-oxoglutarate dehydrogenase E2 component (dihydrolipoamide succinyltransferase)